MRIFILSMIIAASSSVAHAETFDAMEVAGDLGSVLASEEPCGLSYSQDDISKFITDKVPTSATSFPGTLNLWIRTRKDQIKEMTLSEKTANCTLVERLAKSYGFIK